MWLHYRDINFILIIAPNVGPVLLMEADLSEGDSDCRGTQNDAFEDVHRVEERGARADDESCDLEDLRGLTVDDILKKVWVSVETAYEYYRRFGKCMGSVCERVTQGKTARGTWLDIGFRERKHDERVDRRREHKPETRTNYKAMLSIFLDKNDKCWKVRKLVTEHNHELTPAGMVHLIANHRGLTETAKSQIDRMQAYGIATAKIVGYMAGMAGGYSLLGFLKKDVYNYADKQQRIKISDGDAHSAIVYLEGKAKLDPNHLFKQYYSSIVLVFSKKPFPKPIT
ncbi:hypothetical protein Ahy_B06g084377 [Arachis hypogaea]|uniref:FAR1 domain-containing protein n=1 Tax=Arachis hypogaea TaxID=3818 RepID=A0A444YRR2_ARAHY|nr:hypothetical protein Ahy_B06g084377 [Arachis hypogaea]